MPKLCGKVELRHAGRTLCVRSNHYSDLDWLVEFVTPQFQLVDAPEVDHVVTYWMDNGLYERSQAQQPAQRKEVNGFIQDTRINQFYLWQEGPDFAIYFDPELKVFYQISKDRKEITILAHSRKSIGARTALMRVVRELITFPACSSRSFLMHGGAFEYEGQGIAIMGKKNSGKGTTLTHFLQSLPAAYISNDRIRIAFEKDQVRAEGVPTIVTLSHHTLEMFPRVDGEFRKHGYHHRYTLRESQMRPYEDTSSYPDWTFTPRQFCHLTQTTSVAGAPLKAILFPQVHPNFEGIKIQELTEAEAARKLSEAKLGKISDGHASVFHPENGAAQMTSFTSSIGRLASQVRCFELQMGMHAFHQADSEVLIREALTQEVALV